MKPQQPTKNNRLSLDKKTIVKLDQSSLSSLNGGIQAAQFGTTSTTATSTTVVPTTEWTTITTVTTAF